MYAIAETKVLVSSLLYWKLLTLKCYNILYIDFCLKRIFPETF